MAYINVRIPSDPEERCKLSLEVWNLTDEEIEQMAAATGKQCRIVPSSNGGQFKTLFIAMPYIYINAYSQVLQPQGGS